MLLRLPDHDVLYGVLMARDAAYDGHYGGAARGTKLG
jgi:methylphosphotriester-DNA--protein-cysteine methyltransferase